MKVSRKDIITALEILAGDEKNQVVTLFCGKLSDVKHRVRVTRRRYKRGGFDKRALEALITVGKPNYREREFLKQCKKAKAKPRRYWISKRVK